MTDIHKELITLIIAHTCVGVFVATAVASVLNLFNLVKLAADIRKKLHTALIVEIVAIAVGVFGGFSVRNRLQASLGSFRKKLGISRFSRAVICLIKPSESCSPHGAITIGKLHSSWLSPAPSTNFSARRA
jgi:hypothetical protein